MLTLLLLSCATGILAQYEAEKAAALAGPSPAGADWQPELRFRVAPASLVPIATAAVDAGLSARAEPLSVDGPLGLRATVEPMLSVRSLELALGEDCGACLQVTAELGGKAKWEVGKASGKAPVEARLRGRLDMELDEVQPGTWAVRGRLAQVDQVRIEVDQLGRVEAGDALRDWVSEAATRAGPFTVGELGGADLGVRAMRLGASGGAVEVQGLTDVAGGGAVSEAPRPLRSGWELRLSQATVLALVRREAFEKGEIAYEVAADPRGLRAEKERFTLDLRLWRLSGAGWWRDYAVEGGLSVEDGRIRMRAEQATEGEKSRGAGLADPLALLAEGAILEAVEDGCKAVLPASRKGKVGGLRVVAEAAGIQGEDDALVVRGTLRTPEASGGPRLSPGQRRP